MMSYQDPPQSKLFYIGVNIDKRIRKNHPLRKIRELIDFDFIYNEVRDKYGYNGNESIPPPSDTEADVAFGALQCEV